MPSRPAAPPAHVALRCDAGARIGVGHAVRCIALGEELRHRGHPVTLWGDLGGAGWLEPLVARAGFGRMTAATTGPALAGQAAAAGFGAVVLDGYDLPADAGARLRADGRTVLAMVDGDYGAGQEADLYVDQNLGSLPHRGGPPGSVALAGADYALFRDSVLDRRRDLSGTPGEIRSVLAVFGGTDPMGAAPVVIPALLATGRPLDITVIAGNPEIAERLAALVPSDGQTLRTIPPSPDLAGLAASADLAISASGSSVWELLAIGVPTAVVCVADNQELGYQQTAQAGVVAPLGLLDGFDRAVATDRLAALIADPGAAAAMARRGQAMFDGDGRRRVADALDARPGGPR
ncbi:spore coat protein [Flexivirga sp. ID2601S]|uniref:Spore coat protein n=1 Tax=Flexivirga aerilata TaxID=1656889 RepID=A0A849ATY1_9MICO|nr:spore coat protein [Flexivirga aerilata]NNG40182.1 spore coat protein [Flexivirga aerilata]